MESLPNKIKKDFIIGCRNWLREMTDVKNVNKENKKIGNIEVPLKTKTNDPCSRISLLAIIDKLLRAWNNNQDKGNYHSNNKRY